MEPMAIGLVSLNSNSETHMTAICDARLIYGMGWISRVFIYMLCNFKQVHFYLTQTQHIGLLGLFLKGQFSVMIIILLYILN